MSLPIPTEYEEQVKFVQYLSLKGYKHTAIPNSTYTTSWNQKRRNKATGLNPGLPDLIAIVNDNLVWIEMKRKKGGVLSQAQKDWIEALERAGQTVYVCKGAEEAIEFIKQIEEEE
jgi:hypothetical protein